MENKQYDEQTAQFMYNVLKSMYPGISEQDAVAMSRSAATSGGYENGPDSREKPDVSKGTLVEGSIVSQLYPESAHAYKVYLPVGYDAEKIYPVTVFLDGVSYYLAEPFSANIVLDNLIAAKRIPAMIGIFIDPGDHGEGMPIWSGKYGEPMSNRSMEYDSVSDTYARFLIEELFPQISSDYPLPSDPELYCICGDSSAGQAAFNAAWHRPDAFRKVITHVGSFVNIRGGDCNIDRIRKNPRKPLRVFMQDGEYDLNIVYGNWPLASRAMASALEYKGYDYRFELGCGGHNFAHAASILPEMLEWIWR